MAGKIEILRKLGDVQADMIFDHCEGKETDSLKEEYGGKISELRKTGYDVFFSLEHGKFVTKRMPYGSVENI